MSSPNWKELLEDYKGKELENLLHMGTLWNCLFFCAGKNLFCWEVQSSGLILHPVLPSQLFAQGSLWHLWNPFSVIVIFFLISMYVTLFLKKK